MDLGGDNEIQNSATSNNNNNPSGFNSHRHNHIAHQNQNIEKLNFIQKERYLLNQSNTFTNHSLLQNHQASNFRASRMAGIPQNRNSPTPPKRQKKALPAWLKDAIASKQRETEEAGEEGEGSENQADAGSDDEVR